MGQVPTERYQDRLRGVLSCYDRIVVTGTLPQVCYAAGMTTFLHTRGIRIFDYARFAEPLRDMIRKGAEEPAVRHGVAIEHIRKVSIRKEDVVARVLERRGDRPGLVHAISAMEACDSYRPWHDKTTGKTFLKPAPGKCLHYYFYVMDAHLGPIYVRVPTWCPFRLQVYCNGHSWLARKLTAAGIGFTLADNAFMDIDDFARAQALADALQPDRLHRILDRYAKACRWAQRVFDRRYRWSLMQVEYATDLVFRSEVTLKPLYDTLSRQAVLAVGAEQVATFLGKKIAPQFAAEIGSRFATRIEGTCIKHRLGNAQVKMYDKFARVVRVETTVNKVSVFKHHRKVEHKMGQARASSLPSRKASTRRSICATSSGRATGAIWSSSPPSTIIPQEPARSIDRPSHSTTANGASKD
ncbi:MAG: hypothetical protein ACREC6_01250 [Hyphomicrobiaceae bacterium]